MISAHLLTSWMVVGGAFLTGLATTVDRAGFWGWTTSLTLGQDRQIMSKNFFPDKTHYNKLKAIVLNS